MTEQVNGKLFGPFLTIFFMLSISAEVGAFGAGAGATSRYSYDSPK
jgi:hypothetical protein